MILFDIFILFYFQFLNKYSLDIPNYHFLVVLRKNLEILLHTATKYYNVFLYTHARQDYTETIIKTIDPFSISKLFLFFLKYFKVKFFQKIEFFAIWEK